MQIFGLTVGNHVVWTGNVMIWVVNAWIQPPCFPSLLWTPFLNKWFVCIDLIWRLVNGGSFLKRWSPLFFVQISFALTYLELKPLTQPRLCGEPSPFCLFVWKVPICPVCLGIGDPKESWEILCHPKPVRGFVRFICICCIEFWDFFCQCLFDLSWETL